MNRKHRQARTRAALIEAAQRVFAERGLADATVDDIAEEAGFTKGAFYANFASKDELYLVLLDRRFAAELERIEHALRGVAAPTAETRDAAREFMGAVWSDPRWPWLFFEFTAHAARDEAFRRKLAERYTELHASVSRLYERWSAGFSMPPPIPLDAITTMTFCMANGFIVEQIIQPDVDAELYPSMLEVFFRGLASMAQEEAGNPSFHAR